MDKQLLKAYIKVMVEEEVKKLLPELLAEAVAEIKTANKLNESVPAVKKPSLDRGRLAELMGINYDREEGTIRASTNGLASRTVTSMDSAGNKVEISADRVDPTVISAINKDYSALMKKMKLT